MCTIDYAFTTPCGQVRVHLAGWNTAELVSELLWLKRMIAKLEDEE